MSGIERLDHAALLCRDADVSAAFYCEWAGMEVVHSRTDGARVIWVRLTGKPESLIIVLIGIGEERPRGYVDHFGFHVASRSDVDGIARRAGDAGILSHEVTEGGPVVGYFCTISDPDGNELEFACEQLRA